MTTEPTITLTPDIWRMEAMQTKGWSSPCVGVIFWRDGYAAITDGNSLLAIPDKQKVPETYRITLQGCALDKDLDVPMRPGIHAFPDGRGGFRVVQITEDKPGTSLDFLPVVPNEKDSTVCLTVGILDRILRAMGKDKDRAIIGVYPQESPLAPVRIVDGMGRLAVIMPVRRH
jgi:hypothetical protein